MQENQMFLNNFSPEQNSRICIKGTKIPIRKKLQWFESNMRDRIREMLPQNKEEIQYTGDLQMTQTL